MRQVKLPGAGISLSRLSFGTARLHRVWSARRRQEILDRALDAGLTHFDTSPLYGFGLAEEELGKFQRRHPGRVTIATKFGLFPPEGAAAGALRVAARKAAGRLAPRLSRPRIDWSLEAAAASLELSLRRLGVDAVDLFLLHEPVAGQVDEPALCEWLESVRRGGRIRAWGVAGRVKGFEPWLPESPLCGVIQTLAGSDVAVAEKRGRRPDLVYGVVPVEAGGAADRQTVEAAVAAAVRRHPGSSLLVSTRKADHLRMLVRAAEEGARGPA